MSFYIVHRHRVCLFEHVDLICSLYNWQEGFGPSSLATLPARFQLWLHFHLCTRAVHWGLLLRLPWRTWVCPSEVQLWSWCSFLGCRSSCSTGYSGKLVAREAGSMVVQKGMATSIGQHAPVFLPGEPPPPPQQRSLADHSPQRRGELDMTNVTCILRRKTFFAWGNSAPVRLRHEGGTAAWLAGTVVMPSMQGHGLPRPEELWPYQSLF